MKTASSSYFFLQSSFFFLFFNLEEEEDEEREDGRPKGERERETQVSVFGGGQKRSLSFDGWQSEEEKVSCIKQPLSSASSSLSHLLAVMDNCEHALG